MEEYKGYDEEAKEPGNLAEDSVNMAVSVKGKILGIPMQAEIARIAGKTMLSGKVSLTEEMLLDMMYHFSPDWKAKFCDSPLYSFIEGLQCGGAMVWESQGNLVLAVRNTSVGAGMVKEGNGLLLLLASAEQQKEGTMAGVMPRTDDSFTEFLTELRETMGALEFCLLFKNGSDVSFEQSIVRLASLEHAAFERSLFENVAVFDRAEFRDVMVLVSAQVDLAKSSLGFFQTLKDIMPENSRVILTAGFGEQLAVLLRMEQIVPNKDIIAEADHAALNIRFLECTFLLGKNPVLHLKGSLSFMIQDAEYLFTVSCMAKSELFALSAEYQSRQKPISLGNFFRLYQLGLTIGVERGAFLAGGWGIVQLGSFDLFAMLFVRCTGSVVTPLAMGLALNSLSVTMLLNLVLPTPIAGMEEFDFLKLEPFPLKAAQMDTAVLADLSSEGLQKIAQAFSKVCQGECGGHMVSPVTADALMVRTVQSGGWMLTDEKNIRHYYISSTGEISLSPQFYLCTEDSLPAGSYTLYRGIFVCASLVLFGVRINFYASMEEKNGLEALVTIAPVDKGWFRLSQVTKKEERIRAAQIYHSAKSYAIQEGTGRMSMPGASGTHHGTVLGADCNVAEQYIYDQEGPGFYLRIRQNDMQISINASIELMKLIKLDVLLAYESGRFNLYTEFNFLALRAKLVLSADYGSMNRGQFHFTILFDLTFFQDIANMVIQMVRKFVSEAQSKLSQAQEKLAYAQKQVLQLKGQIDAVNGKIAQYSEELRRLRWWQFYKAPYLLLVLGGLELEKAGIYIALGAAYAALEIAKQVLELVKVTTGALGYLIQKLAEAISSIFYLKNISLVMDAQLASGLQAKLGTCFTLFGKDYTAEVSLSLQGKEGDVKSRLHSGASDQIHTKTEAELNGMKLQQEQEEERVQAIGGIGQMLGAFLRESEFPYYDCAGYRQCLQDSFDFVGKSAVTYGRMEALYQQDYGYADPLEERHAGQMSRNLSMTKVQWQGVFSAVERMDCEELVDEVKKQVAVQNVNEAYGQNALEDLEKHWEELKKLQTMIQSNSERIADLDSYFNRRRIQVRESTVNRLGLLRKGINEAEPAPDVYYTDIFKAFAVDNNTFDHVMFQTSEEEGFTFDDKENFFINPANEPIVDRLFQEVCMNTPDENLKQWVTAVKQDEERKEGCENYRIRIDTAH